MFVFQVLKHRVIDGDSIEVILDLGFNLTLKQVCRIDDVDAPERHTEAGKLVKTAVKELLAGQKLTCYSYKLDKFAGRFVGDIYVNGVALSLWLIQKGYAKAYNGGAKQPWTGEELRRIETSIHVVK